MSRRRAEVSAALGELPGFVSAQDVYAGMRSAGSPIGLATVYRALQSMVDDGEADLLRAPEGEALYRRCSGTHHHHLVCRSCGRTVEVKAPSVERWARDVAARHGFTDAQHTVEVTGICATCT